MTTKKPAELKDGDQCTVTNGVHKGKSGTVRDIATSKTGQITITVVQKNGDRFKTLGRNVAPAPVPAAKKGKLAELKTKATVESVGAFIGRLDNGQKREDSTVLVSMMEKLSREKARMWGTSIIGFGDKRFKSPNTGREVDWFKIGFSPRKAAISLYLVLDKKTRAASLEKLGKYKTDGGCIYINKLADVNIKVLEGLIKEALKTK